MDGDNRSRAAAAPPSSSAAVRQRTNALRRSCEACRAVKAKCVVEPREAGTDQPRCCKRCQDHHISCVFENALARPKKLKYSARTRVKNVEEKLDGLIALISAKREANAHGPSEAAPSPAAAAANAQGIVPALQTSAPVPSSYSVVLAGTSSQPPYSLPVSADVSFDNFPGSLSAAGSLAPYPVHAFAPYYGDVIDRGIVDEELAQSLLADFKSNSVKQFPFVTLPSYATLGYMRRERPFVLLAVLTATCDVPLQTRLALEYRKVLAQTMIVESESSLDLLQSLLVYCTWHYKYFKPYSNQLYQLSQMAATMAVEINLPGAPSPAYTNFLPSCLNGGHTSLINKRTSTNHMEEDLERARTFLGAYCHSSSIAAAHRKPTHLKYDRRMDLACQFLASAQDVTSDVCLLPYHVQVRKLAEDVDRVFCTVDQGDYIADGRYIETMVKDFERRYEELKNSMTPEAWENAALRCAIMYLPITIYEVSLQIPAEHLAILDAEPSGGCCNWCGSATRLGILMKCIHAAQAFINCYLDLSVEEARHVTIIEVSRHIDAVLVLIRASISNDTRNFSRGGSAMIDLVAAADVERYLQASDRKLTSLLEETMTTTQTDGGCLSQEEKQDSFWQLRQIMRKGGAWYRKHVLEITDAGMPPRPIDAEESAKLKASPIVWLSDGSAVAMAQCPSEQTGSSDLDRTAAEVDKILESLNASGQPQPNQATAATMATDTPSIAASATASASASASTSMSDVTSNSTPASDVGHGITAANGDFEAVPDFGLDALPPWIPGEPTNLFDNLAPTSSSSSSTPWFAF